MRPTKNSIAFAGSLAAVVLAAPASADPIEMSEQPHHVTTATITIDAPPAQIYALATDYAHWQANLTDVRSVKVERGGRDDARVRFRSRALQHEVVVQFDNVADHEIRFRGVEGPPGGRASGTYFLEPLDGGRRTRIVASLYLEVVGLPGWFVSDSKLRGLREAKLRADLTDLARAFAQRAPHGESPTAMR